MSAIAWEQVEGGWICGTSEEGCGIYVKEAKWYGTVVVKTQERSFGPLDDRDEIMDFCEKALKLLVTKKISGFFNDYRFLNNNYRCPPLYLTDDTEKVEYPTICHAFAAAAVPPEYIKVRKDIADQETTAAVKRLSGRSVMRQDWSKETQVRTMYELVLQKFSKQLLKDRLLETDEVKLEHLDMDDCFFGIVDGFGENKLGIILMQIRKELKQKTE